MGPPNELNLRGYNVQQHTDSVKEVSKEETAMDDLISSFRDIAFRMSVKEAQEKNDGKLSTELVVAQNISYVSNSTRVQYATDEDALALAVVVSLISPVATLILFWGFWRLGRKVTMSPLGVINAMPVSSATGAQNGTAEVAQVFADCKGNVEGAAVADYVRKKDCEGSEEPKLQYGVVEETGRLGMVHHGGGEWGAPGEAEGEEADEGGGVVEKGNGFQSKVLR